jgi:hypothetical protein
MAPIHHARLKFVLLEHNEVGRSTSSAAAGSNLLGATPNKVISAIR